MLVLATALTGFAEEWRQVMEGSMEVVQVKSMFALESFLTEKKVQLIVLDINLEGSRDPQAIQTIADIGRPAKLILGGIPFSSSAELVGLAAGAVACCPPALSVMERHKIVEIIRQGGIWLSKAGIPALVDRLRQFSESHPGPVSVQVAQAKKTASDAAVWQKLTKREREIAEMVSKGANNKEIARRLLISDRTVKAHLSTIFGKLKVPDRLQLALLVSGRSSADDASETGASINTIKNNKA